MRTRPRGFQVKGIRFLMKRNGRAILGDDMGLGKTYQAIAYLALHPEARPAVIICPASLKLNWQRELWRHARLRSVVLDGTTPGPVTQPIAILNYDIAKAWVPTLQRLGAKVVVLDEVQKIKNRTTKRARACRSICLKSQGVLGLSGTPITNRPIEFFPILNLVDPQQFPSFREYAMRYCAPKRGFRGRGWDFTGASHLEELHGLVSPLMIRRTKTEVLKELPPKIRTAIPVEISEGKNYNKARREFIDWLSHQKGKLWVDRALRAQALVRMGALRRIIAKGKLKPIIAWIKDWLENTDEKLVLFAIHRKIIEALVEVFPKALVIDGRVPPNKRQRIVDQFQTDPSRRLFIGNIKAAGEGLTLTASSTVAFLELGWTPAEHDQAEDRVLRIGQTATSVNIFYFIGTNTIEEKHLKMLDRKRRVVNTILDGKPDATTSLAFEEIIKSLLRKERNARSKKTAKAK